METEIRNAIIESTQLGKEDHGLMTAMIIVKYNESVKQGFGGYTLDEYDNKKDKRVGHAWGMEFIMRVLEVVGVENWEDLPGHHIRVKFTPTKILAIGNILEDVWFDPSELK